MCLRLVFLMITWVISWLRLSQREEARQTAGILILRHQLAVLQRRQPPEPELGGPGTARDPVRRDAESAAPRAPAASRCGDDPVLAPRHRPPSLAHPRTHSQADSPRWFYPADTYESPKPSEVSARSESWNPVVRQAAPILRSLSR
jgi:hypothetical protein